MLISTVEANRIREELVSRFSSLNGFERAAGLPMNAVYHLLKGEISPKRRDGVLVALRDHAGMEVDGMAAPETAAPIHLRSSQLDLTASDCERLQEMIRASGYSSIRSFSLAVGLGQLDIHMLLRNKLSPERFQKVREAVHQSLGVDILDKSRYFVPDLPTVDPLDQLFRDGHISPRERGAGMLVRQAAGGAEYPGRFPDPWLQRLWPPEMRTVWDALSIADAETDACRPRLPTASLVCWNVAVGFERLDLDLRISRFAQVALTSLRVALYQIAECSI